MSNTVSIIMGIYNCAGTLPEAIESILAQTYTNWELIMCDDGSSDSTLDVARSYQARYPDRIVVLSNGRNLGLNRTLNHCLAHARGTYIARMDGDDISLPQRLEKEAAFLDENPEYAIVSCPMIYFDENGDWGQGTEIMFPQPADFINGTPFCHAPCMVRAEAYRAVGGYSEKNSTLRAEDYHLWFCMYASGYRGANLMEPLYKMRDGENAYHRRKFRYAWNEAYVRYTGFQMLRLPLRSYIYAARPIVVNLLPKALYKYLHHRRKTACTKETE